MSDRPPCPRTGKLSYASRTDANAARTALTTSRRTRGGSKRALGNLDTFKCDVCGSWHLGRPRAVNTTMKTKLFWGAEG